MNRNYLFVVLILATGCNGFMEGFGGEPGSASEYNEVHGDALEKLYDTVSSNEIVTETDIPCIGHISSEFPFMRKDMVWNVLKARTMMNERKLVPADQFCEHFKDAKIKIYATVWLPHTTNRVGQYNSFTGDIKLDLFGGALLHELLHRWQAQHQDLRTGTHNGWSDNGYFAADKAFTQQAARICEYHGLCSHHN